MASYLISFFFFTLAEFSIWTREAGAGGLSIAVEGPSKAEISFEDRKDGSCGVSYIVKEPGRTFTPISIYQIAQCQCLNVTLLVLCSTFPSHLLLK